MNRLWKRAECSTILHTYLQPAVSATGRSVVVTTYIYMLLCIFKYDTDHDGMRSYTTELHLRIAPVRSRMLQNGVLVSLPYVFMYFLTLVVGQLGDFLRQRKIFSTTTVRKLFQIICKRSSLRYSCNSCIFWVFECSCFRKHLPIAVFALQRSVYLPYSSSLLDSWTARTATCRLSS